MLLKNRYWDEQDVQFVSDLEHVRQLLVQAWHVPFIPMYDILEQVSTHLALVSR